MEAPASPLTSADRFKNMAVFSSRANPIPNEAFVCVNEIPVGSPSILFFSVVCDLETAGHGNFIVDREVEGRLQIEAIARIEGDVVSVMEQRACSRMVVPNR